VGAALPATAAGSGEFGLEGTERVLVDQVTAGAVTPRLARTSAEGGPLEWNSWGYNTARAHCSEAASSFELINK
jgi:hypothetical protein